MRYSKKMKNLKTFESFRVNEELVYSFTGDLLGSVMTMINRDPKLKSAFTKLCDHFTSWAEGPGRSEMERASSQLSPEERAEIQNKVSSLTNSEAQRAVDATEEILGAQRESFMTNLWNKIVRKITSLLGFASVGGGVYGLLMNYLAATSNSGYEGSAGYSRWISDITNATINSPYQIAMIIGGFVLFVIGLYAKGPKGIEFRGGPFDS